MRTVEIMLLQKRFKLARRVVRLLSDNILVVFYIPNFICIDIYNYSEIFQILLHGSNDLVVPGWGVALSNFVDIMVIWANFKSVNLQIVIPKIISSESLNSHITSNLKPNQRKRLIWSPVKSSSTSLLRIVSISSRLKVLRNLECVFLNLSKNQLCGRWHQAQHVWL